MTIENFDNKSKDAAPPSSATAADIWGGPGGGGGRGGSGASTGPERGESAEKKILPGLTITADEPHRGIVSIPGHSPQLTGPTEGSAYIPTPPKQWTVAVDFATTLYDGKGAEDKLPRLELMAEETKGTSVNIVVHAERLIGDDGVLATSDDSLENSHRIDAGLRDGHTVTERYFIHDGQIERLADEFGMGNGIDTAGLLKDAENLAPSEKLGLIIQSHGMGAGGLSTNTGNLSLDATKNAIEAGLAGGPHQKLDLLDFDSCDMAETTVLKKMQPVADDVVASQSVEFATRTHDGQNLNAALRALLQAPSMSGKELGETIVKQAAEGANGRGAEDGTPTLANFDLTKYGDFEQKLNQFGAALNEVDGDPTVMKLLHSQIEITSKPQTTSPGNTSSEKDLRSFVEGVITDSESHMISGNTSNLEAAAKDLLSSMNNMVTAHYGEKEKLYDKNGGLDTPLPGSETLNGEVVDRELNPLNWLTSLADGMAGPGAKGMKMSGQETLLQYARPALDDIATRESDGNNLEVLQLQRDILEVSDAQNQGDLKNAVRRFQTDLHTAQQGELGVDMAEAVRPAAKALEKRIAAAPAPTSLAPDWEEFIRRVQAGAK